jgi:DNA-binding transcriptional MerR regulator
MTDTPDTEMRLQELAERSGVSARTIRLYISQGVLPGPLRAGRDAAYDTTHLTRLEEIRVLQQEGLTLSAIRLRFAGPDELNALPSPIPYLAFPIGPDVIVHVQREVDPWRMRQILTALNALASTLTAAPAGHPTPSRDVPDPTSDEGSNQAEEDHP